MDLRWNDYSLSPEEASVEELFARFFTRNSSSIVVRAAEPENFDPNLWSKLVDIGGVSMSLPEDRGGQGGGLIELVLAVEQAGYFLAPIPLGEHVVAARLLSRLEGPDIEEAISEALVGTGILAIAPEEQWGSPRPLLSYGAIGEACGRHGPWCVGPSHTSDPTQGNREPSLPSTRALESRRPRGDDDPAGRR